MFLQAQAVGAETDSAQQEHVLLCDNPRRAQETGMIKRAQGVLLVSWESKARKLSTGRPRASFNKLAKDTSTN